MYIYILLLSVVEGVIDWTENKWNKFKR